MRVLFAGYGSIARRHIGNLRYVMEGRGTALEIDLLRSREAPLPACAHAVFTRISEVPSGYDAVFVTNPTACHYDTLVSLLGTSECFFVEKPVFSNADADLAPFPRGKLYYVACPLRYTNVIGWAKRNVDFSRVRAARAICSSYLPDWRPGSDYRKTYSAHAYMGGGVHIDLVHEWDYLTYLMGYPDNVKSVIARKSHLEIDSCDVAAYVAEYGDKVVELHLDYFGRVPMRRLELITDDDTITCDLIAGRVEFARSGRILDLHEGRDDFQRREIEHFLDLADTGTESDNGLEEALNTLKITRGEL